MAAQLPSLYNGALFYGKIPPGSLPIIPLRVTFLGRRVGQEPAIRLHTLA